MGMVLPILWMLAASCPADSLKTSLEHIASQANGRVGVSAAILEGGPSVALRGAEHFPMQSVYKLPIAMAVADAADRLPLDRKIRLTPQDYEPRLHSPIREKHPNGVTLTVAELLRYSVSESDNTASDLLLKLLGGPPRVMSYLDRIGVRDIAVLNSEHEINTAGGDRQYRNFATPDAAVLLLRKLNQPLLLQYMTQTVTGPRRLKGLLPPGTVVAHKTGTSGTHDGMTPATNDIGLITLPNGRHIVIAVFVSDARAAEEIREGVIARIAKAVWDCWSR